METRLFTHHTISKAVYLFQQGELIAFPTETVYGLGANATNSQAVENIFKTKGRPADNPLIVHIPEISHIQKVSNDWSKSKEKLAQSFWPGPLTIVTQRHPSLSPLVSAGLETVGVRIPAHPLALEFLSLAGCPVAAPSANVSGRPSPTTYEMVCHDLSGKIAGILKSSQRLTYGLESTVVSLEEDKKVLFLLRDGFISKEDLAEVLPDFTIKEGVKDKEKASPGTRYAHYQPSMPVKLFSYKEILDISKIPSTKKIGFLIWKNSFELEEQLLEKGWEKQEANFKKDGKSLYFLEFRDLGDYAKGYYEALFKLEQKNCSLILAQDCPEEWIGRALKNRLLKSSAGAWL